MNKKFRNWAAFLWAAAFATCLLLFPNAARAGTFDGYERKSSAKWDKADKKNKKAKSSPSKKKKKGKKIQKKSPGSNY